MEDETPRTPPVATTMTNEQRDVVDEDAVEYDAETDTYRSSFVSSTESVSVTIATTVAAAAETNPMDLPPLYSVVDTEALETLVEPPAPGTAGSDVRISFPFAGYSVTVHSYGIIAVQPQD